MIAFQRIKQANPRATARLAFKKKFSVDFLHSLPHIAQTVSGGLIGWLDETFSIVPDRQHQLLRLLLDVDPHCRGM